MSSSDFLKTTERWLHKCLNMCQWLREAGVSEAFMTAECWRFPTLNEDKFELLGWKRQSANSKHLDQALVTTALFLASLPGWLATGTCRWWGNLTLLWWGVVLSSVCGEQVWDGSRSWAAAERWWGGQVPEEGLHLVEETGFTESEEHAHYSKTSHVKP